jgi:hypothetical protein
MIRNIFRLFKFMLPNSQLFPNKTSFYGEDLLA